jgi:hypothetical protein
MMLTIPAPLAAQERTAAPALRLFLDCSGFYCDSDYYRTEIGFVDHVRNRQDADMHLLITPQQTGGGGTEYTLLFIGQRGFEGMSDTLRHHTPQTATEDERRSGLASIIKLGLARYAARTAAAEGLAISYAVPAAQAVPEAAVRDPWNLWTFRTSVRGFFNGESRFSSRSVNGSLSASRITDDWKIQFSANGNQSRQRFEIDSLTTITSRQEGYGLSNLTVKSLSDHWSAGARTSASSSTFLNQDLHFRFGPAIEYSFYPYEEATRRQFTVQYTAGISHYNYDEITIFDQLEETLPDHSLRTSIDLKQPWGSLSFSVEGAQFLHEPERYRGVASGDMDVRLVKGLSLNFFGSMSYIRDQIHLSAAGATPEEVLLRLQQLETNYRYFASMGISYTFGSIFNNVVNPRFGGRGGGGGIVIFN